MSNDVLNWAKRITVGGQTRKAVLLLLADHADDKGRAWPSQGTVAAILEMSERTVRGAIKDLTDAGIIARKPRWRDDGTRGTDILRFDMDLVNRNELPVINQPANGAKSTGKRCQINRQMPPSLPAPVAGNTSQGEPPVGNPHKQNSSEAIASGSAGAAPLALSLKDRLWMDGPLAMEALGETNTKSRQMIGRWLRQTNGDAGRVLWAIEEAVRAGSGDPIAYVSRILAESPGGASEPKKQGRANPYFEVAEQEWERQNGTGPDAHGFRPRLVASSGF